MLLQKFDCLELFNDVGEGVGNDCDHDEESEDQDEDGGHDRLDILEADPPVLQDGASAPGTERSAVSGEY